MIILRPRHTQHQKAMFRNRQFTRCLEIGFVCIVSFILGTYYTKVCGNKDSIGNKWFSTYSIYPGVNSGFYEALKSQATLLVILIISHPKNTERRAAIRQTWLNIQDHALWKDIRPFFVVGHTNLSQAIAKELVNEMTKHKDMLSIPIQESYGTLTKKVLSSFVEVEKNVKFSFLLKVDDDSFVDLARVVDELRNSKYNQGLYWGLFDGRAPVLKTGKWSETEYVLCDR